MVVQLLLDAGADIEAESRTGHTPLGHALQAGHCNIVHILLHNGADANGGGSFGYTPLHRAMRLVREICIEARWPQRGQDAAGAREAMERMLVVVEMLLDKGADVRASTCNGNTAEDLAWEYRGICRIKTSASRPWMMGLAGPVFFKFITLLSTAERTQKTLRAVAMRTAACEAFAMGLHERLGAQSLIQGLDADVMRMILDLA